MLSSIFSSIQEKHYISKARQQQLDETTEFWLSKTHNYKKQERNLRFLGFSRPQPMAKTQPQQPPQHSDITVGFHRFNQKARINREKEYEFMGMDKDTGKKQIKYNYHDNKLIYIEDQQQKDQKLDMKTVINNVLDCKIDDQNLKVFLQKRGIKQYQKKYAKQTTFYDQPFNTQTLQKQNLDKFIAENMK